MSKIYKLDDTIDKGVAKSNEGIHASPLQAVDDLLSKYKPAIMIKVMGNGSGQQSKH